MGLGFLCLLMDKIQSIYIPSSLCTRVVQSCTLYLLHPSPVRIIEYLPDHQTLGGLCEPDHILRGADLHERKVRGLGQLGS